MPYEGGGGYCLVALRYSTRNPRVVGSSLSCAMAVTGHFPSVYPLSKAMVCSAQSMGHCT